MTLFLESDKLINFTGNEIFKKKKTVFFKCLRKRDGLTTTKGNANEKLDLRKIKRIFQPHYLNILIYIPIRKYEIISVKYILT